MERYNVRHLAIFDRFNFMGVVSTYDMMHEALSNSHQSTVDSPQSSIKPDTGVDDAVENICKDIDDDKKCGGGIRGTIERGRESTVLSRESTVFSQQSSVNSPQKG